jgi:hypothetical protein
MTRSEKQLQILGFAQQGLCARSATLVTTGILLDHFFAGQWAIGLFPKNVVK